MYKQTFDYIIVGGGSAGCVVANRLSENPANRVCLIEAGPNDSHPLMRIPLALFFSIRNKNLNWKFWTEPQKNCHKRQIFWPSGLTLGGGSAINAMCYVRGNPEDYNTWEKLGCKGWSYPDILPYFKKMENFEPGENAFHGVGGPMNVSLPRYLNPLMHAFIHAGKQMGYPVLDDYNAGSQYGVGFCHVTQKNGRRFSNADAYLHPIKHRKNLTLLVNTRVIKILFDHKKATGVQYIYKNKRYDIAVEKEIVLSAGAIGTPHLLLLSGVGPQSEILKHGIPLIHDLPGVGENLQDHLDIHITCLDKTRTSISFRLSYLWRFLKGCFNYFLLKRGEFTSNYVQATGFIKSNPDISTPDLQWNFAPSMHTHSALNLKPVFKQYGFTLMVCILHPKSRGKITLKDANPLTKPCIDANYLADETDLETMVVGFKKSRELLEQASFKPYFLTEYQPGKSIQSDDDIKHYIREFSDTIYHPVGTCKMGQDNMSVVDPTSLKIHGLTNIRIMDASIMPTITSGNTNAPTTMIAEKGSDMMLSTK